MQSSPGSELGNKKTVFVYLLAFRWLSLAYVSLFFLLQKPFFRPLNFATLFFAILYVLSLTLMYKIILAQVLQKPILLGADLVLSALFLILGGWPKAWFFYSLTPIVAASLFWGYVQGLLFAVVTCAAYLSTLIRTSVLFLKKDLILADSFAFATVAFLFVVGAVAFLSSQWEKKLRLARDLEQGLAQKTDELDKAESGYTQKIVEVVQGTTPVIASKDPSEILLLLADNARKFVRAEKTVAGLFNRRKGRVEIDAATLVVRGRKDQHLESWWKPELDEMAKVIFDKERHPDKSQAEESLADRALRRSNKESSLICVPLKAGSKYIGILSALNAYPYFFADDEISLLAALGEQAAVAISAAKRPGDSDRSRGRGLEKELETITTKCLQSQEAERKRISRELHDNTAQSLTHLVIRMQKMNTLILPEQAELKNSMSKLIAIAERTLEEVHEMAFQMRPAILEDLGLIETINWYISHYLGTATLAVNFASAEKNVKFPPHVEIAVLRMVQEGLTNIRKYARASEAFVNLDLVDDELIVTIQDNGEGFDVEKTLEKSAEKKSLGIMGMKERAELLGGSLEIISHPGEGTRIVANIPLRFKK